MGLIMTLYRSHALRRFQISLHGQLNFKLRDLLRTASARAWAAASDVLDCRWALLLKGLCERERELSRLVVNGQSPKLCDQSWVWQQSPLHAWKRVIGSAILPRFGVGLSWKAQSKSLLPQKYSAHIHESIEVHKPVPSALARHRLADRSRCISSMRSKNDMRVMQHIWLCALITCKDWFCYRWRVLPNRCFQYHPLLTGACWLEQTSLTRMWPIKMKQNERSLDFVKAGVNKWDGSIPLHRASIPSARKTHGIVYGGQSFVQGHDPRSRWLHFASQTWWQLLALQTSWIFITPESGGSCLKKIGPSSICKWQCLSGCLCLVQTNPWTFWHRLQSDKCRWSGSLGPQHG